MITKEQKQAIKHIFDRCPVYRGGKSSDELAKLNGWRFNIYNNKRGYPEVMFWDHPQSPYRYKESRDIVRDFDLADQMSYLEFRRTVKQGL